MTATLSPPAGAATLTSLPLDSIHIEEGFNPRTTMDDAKLAEITASVQQVGVIQPIIVTPTDQDDVYQLIAGHRRVAAARAAQLVEVPSLIYETLDEQTRLQLAMIENLQREDLGPIDEASGYERAMRDFSLTQKQLAEIVGKSASHISERLRLRKLPDGCQQLIAAGTIPLSAVKSLATIARCAPAVADGCARLIAEGEAEIDDLISEPHYVVTQLCDAEWDDAPFVHPCRNYSGAIRIGRFISDEELATLEARASALGVTRFAFTDEDLDAARAYKCLLEIEGGYTTHCYITDARFAYDRLVQALDTAEAAQTAQIDAQHAQEASEGSLPDAAIDEASDDVVVRAQRLEQKRRDAEQRARTKEREQKDKRRLDAIAANRQLGLNLTKKLGSKTLDRDTAQLLATLVLHANHDLAARGIRLTHEDYHALEHSRQKNGKVRTKFTPIEPYQAREQLEAWVLRPKQPEEIIGRLLQALIAGTFADQNAVTKAQVTHWSAQTSAAALIAKLAGKLVPDHFKPQLERLLPAKTPAKKRGKDAS